MEVLCQLAGAELADLVRQSDDNRERLSEVDRTARTGVVQRHGLLVVAICALNRYRFEDVLKEYDFSEPELQQLFVRLDRLGIIELLPANRYRLRVARNFRWRAGGPIEQLMVKSILSSFLDRTLLRQQDHFRFSWGTLTSQSVGEFRTRLNHWPTSSI